MFIPTLFYKILFGTTLVGITTGILGCFMLLNKKSLLGDTIAHATLPGITGMFLLIGHQSYVVLLTGAAMTGLCAAACVHAITSTTDLKQDAALGVILSTFFGIGIIFLTMIQKLEDGHQAGIDKFLFGQAATLLTQDIACIAIISMVVIAIIFYYFKELAVITFDPIYARTIGIPVTRMHQLLIVLMVLTVIVGLHTVGLILMSSFLIAPAAAARQWTNRLSTMITISIAVSIVATTAGTIISYHFAHMPTGPVIVIIATIITLASIACARLSRSASSIKLSCNHSFEN